MILKDYLDNCDKTGDKITLNIETEVAGCPALLLMMYETPYEADEDDDEEYDDEDFCSCPPETVARITVLCEMNSSMYEDDDEDEGIDEDYDSLTIRELLTNELNEVYEPDPSDVTDFSVNGVEYTVFSSDYDYIDCCSYNSMSDLKEIYAMNVIPDRWLEKDIHRLAIAVYDIHPNILNADFSLHSNIEIICGDEPVSRRIGSVIQLTPGHYDIPRSLIVQDDEGEMISVKIHGAYPLEFPDLPDEDMIVGPGFPGYELLDDDCCSELPGQFIIEYSTDDDITLNFYLPEVLNSTPAHDESDACIGSAAGLGLISFDERYQDRRLSVAGNVPEDYDPQELVTVELFSYTKY